MQTWNRLLSIRIYTWQYAVQFSYYMITQFNTNQQHCILVYIYFVYMNPFVPSVTLSSRDLNKEDNSLFSNIKTPFLILWKGNAFCYFLGLLCSVYTADFLDSQCTLIMRVIRTLTALSAPCRHNSTECAFILVTFLPVVTTRLHDDTWWTNQESQGGQQHWPLTALGWPHPLMHHLSQVYAMHDVCPYLKILLFAIKALKLILQCMTESTIGFKASSVHFSSDAKFV